MIYLNVAEPDAIGETLSWLKEALTGDEIIPLPVPLSLDSLYGQIRQETPFHRSVEHLIHRDTSAIIEQLRRERRRRNTISQHRLECIKARREQLRLQVEQTRQNIEIQLSNMDRYVADVQANAFRRLQVLLFECIGEMKKAIARAEQRVIAQEACVDTTMSTCEVNHAWAIFLKRCEEEFNLTTFIDIPPFVLSKDASTFVPNDQFNSWASALKSLISKKLDSTARTENGSAVSVSRIMVLQTSKLPSGNKTRLILAPEATNSPNSSPRGMMTAQYQSFCRLLSEYTSLSKPTSRRRQKAKTQIFPDGFSCTTPLSSSTIRWLPHAAHGPLHVPVNGSIYYCLDEYKYRRGHKNVEATESLLRIASPNLHQNAAVASSDRLALQYASDMDVNVALDGIFQVQNVVKTDHVLQATLEAFPHMRPLHFAPANVSHLIQSTTYHDLVMTFTEEHQANLTMRYPLETFGAESLTHFYVAIPTASTSNSSNHLLLACKLHPISSDAMRTLIATYVIRDPSITDTTSLFSLYRQSFGPAPSTAYCIVEHPAFILPPGSDVPPALVVQYSTRSSPLPRKDATAEPMDSTVSLLGSFCRWRSCLDMASMGQSLCANHTRLERHLKPEERMQIIGPVDNLDISAKTMVAPSVEIKRIKHSSSLLEELLQKQLGATLQAFLDKVVGQGCNAALVQAFHASRTSDRALGSDNSVEQVKNLLEQIWEMEQATTDEISALAALGVYPTVELGLLKQEEDATQTMAQAAERKLRLFRTRRQEEEAKKQVKKRHPLLQPSKSCPVVAKGLAGKLKKPSAPKLS
ncbi:hypothetical protein LEN26_006876 [Aphanomyces euteiches]|nr:hypothetical protein AeMF1_003218 [Aphanomyces euteiches]KAH9134070.1 hypothetical protein LEN26_006876 [Aphanomyces euteiches]KAH9186660.1 hypothetical protein AeNC1_011367 [Aphanomyces euteiches]